MTDHPYAVRLGRHVNHDPRSRAFPAPTVMPAPVTWAHHGTILDQGQLGSCTANALWQSLMTGPLYRPAVKATEAKARKLYHDETVIEGGPVYPPADPGGSGLAVCQAAQQEGLIGGYAHAFGIDHARGAIAVSPFIVGSNWYEGMFTPDAHGFVVPTGQVAGGHEYLCLGYDPTADEWLFLNSWGRTWGVAVGGAGVTGGAFRMTGSTFARLLAEQGDITVPALTKPTPITVTSASPAHEEPAVSILSRLRSEPVAVAAVVSAGVDLAVALGTHISPGQKGAVMAFVTAALGLVARQQVAPTGGGS